MNEQNDWELKEYSSSNQLVQISAIDISIPLKDIYEGTKLEKDL